MDFQRTRRHLKAPVPVGFTLPDLPGLDLIGSELRFDRSRYSEEQASWLTAFASGAPVYAPTIETTSRSLVATDADLEAINQAALVELTADDVIVYERYVVNNQLSRTLGLRFSKGALERLAEDFARGLSRALLDHLPTFGGHGGAKLVGRTFAAEVVEATVRGLKGLWVKTREYIPKAGIAPQHLSLITSGVLSFDSIGIVGGGIRAVETGQGDILEITDDQAARVPLQAREVTFVYLGEIRGAGSDRGLEKSHATGNHQTKQTSWVISI